MHTEPQAGDVRHTKPKHLAERFQGLIGMIMVGAIVLLAIGLVYGILTAGSPDPKWML